MSRGTPGHRLDRYFIAVWTGADSARPNLFEIAGEMPR